MSLNIAEIVKILSMSRHEFGSNTPCGARSRPGIGRLRCLPRRRRQRRLPGTRRARSRPGISRHRCLPRRRRQRRLSPNSLFFPILFHSFCQAKMSDYLFIRAHVPPVVPRRRRWDMTVP